MSIRSIVLHVRTRFGMSGFELAVLAMLVLSVGLNIAQASKISVQRHVIARLRDEGRLLVGTAVKPMAVETLAGQPAQIAYSDVAVPTVIYVFSPKCGWCGKNASNIKALASGARSRFRFIGISTVPADVETYVANGEINFDVYVKPSPASIEEYALGGTPTTLVVSPAGRVLKVWSGAYGESTRVEIEKYFGVTLPGLSS